MPYEPAKGEHLNFLKKIEEIHDKNKMSESTEYYGSHINIDHSIEGVRVNGWERLITIHDILTEAKHDKVKLKSKIKKLLKVEKANNEILELINQEYKICPECKGKKGYHTPSDRGGGYVRTSWDDCTNCNGIGMILKPK